MRLNLCFIGLGLAATVSGQAPDTFNPGAGNLVVALAIQTDGKILAGGSFSSLNGLSSDYLGRLNSDGSLDTSFNSGADSPVYCVALQTNGEALVGGSFTTLSGQSCSCLGRLNSDGTFDSSFNAQVSDSGYVYSLAVQPNGQIIAGGAFTRLGGQPSSRLGRLNSDGSLDANFNGSADSLVYSLALQSDGKVLVGGNFTMLSGQPTMSLGRLNSDGTPDAGFTGGANGTVYCLALQSDGKILVGGSFTSLAGEACTNFGRLTASGVLDHTFFSSANGPVNSLAVQADGMIFVAGDFATLSGGASPNLGRIYANGLLDVSYNSGADNSVSALAIQSDGDVLVGGAFQNLIGQPRSCLGRLSNTEAAGQSLTFSGSTVTWLRSGASPEVWGTSFDFTTNGTTWVGLGPGTRISGGWQLTGVSAPANSSVRTRGYLGGGQYNGSGWYVENITGPAVISRQPANVLANAGSLVSFNVQAGGTATLSYQWRKNGVNLNGGGGIFGAQTATLAMSNVLGGNAGGYSVVVTNASGSATSAVATLTVIDPVITSQPSGDEISAGQNATFTVTAVGTPPLLYQWRMNTTNFLGGATNASLTLTNAQGGNGGNYDVIVASGFGSVTSAVAVLKVDVATADSFDPEPSGSVFCIALQTDGKVLTGGTFTNLAGLPCNCLGRLNTDGSLDTNFLGSAGTPGPVYSLAIQPDGKILVGGIFNLLAGVPCTNLGRLNTNGSLDTNFNAFAGSGKVLSLTVQTDGKILVGGTFTTLSGRAITNLARLNANGTLDTNFNPKCTSGSQIYSVVLQSDGKIIVGGGFSKLGGLGATNIGRLNVDGSLDGGFAASASGVVDCLAVQADGKVLVGGGFSSLNNYGRSNIGRFNTNGTPDLTFNPGASDYVLSLVVQADGNIIAGGQFKILGGQNHTNFCRLSSSGAPDSFFDPHADGKVNCLALQADGKVLVGGAFLTLGSQTRSYLGRLNNTSAATQTLTCDGSTATWLRGGSGPEVSRVFFETSTNGTNWSLLGAAARISGGWQLGGLSIPNAATLRASGLVRGGYYNGSGWFVQSTGTVQVVSTPQLAILINDGNFGLRSNRFGFNLSSTPGQVVVIEATSDFLSWSPIQTNLTTSTGLVSFSDPQFGLFAHRFYRARIFNGTLPPPSIIAGGSGFGFQGGLYGFSLTGIGGQTVVIQASTNLLNWVPLATNTLGNSQFFFSDTASTNFPQRFYRAKVQ